MGDHDLITALASLRVETGSLACLGCKNEDHCTIYGCALIRAAGERIVTLQEENRHIRQTCYSQATVETLMADLERVTAERDAALADLYHNDACDICTYGNSQPGCDAECETCELGCPCRFCEDDDRWQWRGAVQNGGGKE